jgi:hypothetical protein
MENSNTYPMNRRSANVMSKLIKVKKLKITYITNGNLKSRLKLHVSRVIFKKKIEHLILKFQKILVKILDIVKYVFYQGAKS